MIEGARTGEPADAEEVAVEEVEGDAAADDFHQPTRGSIFSAAELFDAPVTDRAAWEEIERADREACGAVWNMYVKASNARGFLVNADANGRRRAAPLKFAQPSGVLAGEETSMPNQRELSDVQRRVLEAYRALEKEKPEGFSNLEVAHRAGLPGKDNETLRGYAAGTLCRLRKRGLITGTRKEVRPGPKPKAAKLAPAPTSAKRQAPPSPPAPKERQKPGQHPAAEPARGDEEELLARLVALRDAHATKVAALDTAIAALRGAG